MKKNSLILIIVVLLCVNVAQCLLMIRSNRALKKSENAVMQSNQAYFTAQQTTESLWNGFVKLDDVAIREELRNVGYLQEVLSESGMVVFIPPFVCGACVDEQCDVLKEALDAGEANFPIRFLTPQFKAKDLKAIFALYPSVKVQTYDYDLLRNQAFRDLNEVLFFASTEDGVRHTMLSVKGSPELTNDYVTFLKK